MKRYAVKVYSLGYRFTHVIIIIRKGHTMKMNQNLRITPAYYKFIQSAGVSKM